MPRAWQNFTSASYWANFCPAGLSMCIARPCFAHFQAMPGRSSFVTSTNTHWISFLAAMAHTCSGVRRGTPSYSLKLRFSAIVFDERSSTMPTSS